jgi:hypothetical protein
MILYAIRAIIPPESREILQSGSRRTGTNHSLPIYHNTGAVTWLSHTLGRSRQGTQYRPALGYVRSAGNERLSKIGNEKLTCSVESFGPEEWNVQAQALKQK